MAERFGIRGRDIELYVQFADAAGSLTNTDDTPTVAVYDSNGTLRQMATNMNVGLSNDPGVYVFTYEIPLSGPDGYWTDVWSSKIGDEVITNTFQFYVSSAGTATESAESVFYPGDGADSELPFVFTKDEAHGVNILLKLVKPRLKNDGVRKVPDGAGGYASVACTIFTDAELIAFLVNSLSEFNQIPHFSSFLFSDPQIYTIFADVMVQGAVLLALAAQALIEKGREFVITDNGVTYQPPAISEMLNSQYTAQLADYKEKVKFIKCNLKPSPRGLGTFRTTSTSPAYLRLRHLRERQVM